MGLTAPEKKSWKAIPYPNDISLKSGSFTFTDGVTIDYSNQNLKQVVEFFEQKLNAEGINSTTNTDKKIILELSPSKIKNPEGYILKITPRKIKLTAKTPQGIFYGLMTVLQNIRHSNTKTVPCGTVNDAPRFEYRGFMLDRWRKG